MFESILSAQARVPWCPLSPLCPNPSWSSSSLWWLWSTVLCASWPCLLPWQSCPCFCHNELHDELADLASRAFTPSAVWDEPVIHTCPGCPVVPPAPPASSAPSPPLCSFLVRIVVIFLSMVFGPVALTVFWMSVLPTGMPKPINPRTLLRCWPPMRKARWRNMHLAPCLAPQWCHFTPFIVSADGLLGCEADAVVCKLAFTWLCWKKWQTIFSGLWLYVQSHQHCCHSPGHPPLSLWISDSLRLYEFSPSSTSWLTGSWCRPESVVPAPVTSVFFFLFCFRLLISFPLLAWPSLSVHSLFCFSFFSLLDTTVLPATPGLSWSFSYSFLFST